MEVKGKRPVGGLRLSTKARMTKSRRPRAKHQGATLMGFFLFLEDLEPRLRPKLGRKLGFDSQHNFYLNQDFLKV
jgi:hypothetical protein